MPCIAILDEIQEESNRMAQHFRAINVQQQPTSSSLLAGTASTLNRAFSSTEDARQFAHFTGWVYAAIRPIAQTIAGLPVRIAKVNRNSKPTRSTLTDSVLPKFLKAVGRDVEVFEDHVLLRILHDPNPLMVYWHLIYITITNLELTGKAFWYLTENKDGHKEIWPLPSHWVMPKHTDKEVFTGWTIRPDGFGEGIDVDPEEIAYFYYPDPSDPVGTISPVWAQMRAVRSDESIQTSQIASFDNGIFPGMAIIVGNYIDDDDIDQGRPLLEKEQRQELYDAIHQNWGGVTKSGEPLILDACIQDIKPITATIREMDYFNSGRITKARITQGLGTNPAIMGELEGANRATSAVARQHFAEFTLNPKVELISQILTKSVGPWVAESNEEIAIWIEPYRPDDREERRKDLALLSQTGSVSRNELRATLQDLPPIVGGDTVLVNQNLQPIPIESERSVKPKSQALRDAIMDPEMAKARWLKNQEQAEAELIEVLLKLFKAQRKVILSNLREAFTEDTGSVAADLLFNQRDWHERFMEAIVPELAKQIVKGAMAELARFNASKQAAVDIEDLLIDLPSEIAQQIREEIATIPTRPYWQEIQVTTRNQLASTLSEGIANGESLHELMLRVEDSKIGVLGDEPMTVRAARIARTETTGALNSGHDTTMRGLAADGLIEKKEWSATKDGFTRDTHMDANGQQVPVNQPFDVGGHPGRFPGDPNLPAAERCNCRCTTLAVQF